MESEIEFIPGWKRGLDLFLIVLSLPLWLPLVSLIALWVGIVSPGPIFYRQARVGLRARRFMILKFRTMKVNSDTRAHEAYLERLMVSETPMVKLDSHGDPRLITGGRLLRAMGLDELPQLFNVIAGEMSLVGPRPCTVNEFEHFDPVCRSRVGAVPGLTGYWQVNGKNNTTFRQMIDMDIYYVRNMSLGLDVSILLRTIPALGKQIAEIWQRSSRSISPHATPSAELK
ncbi:MAG: sugar transferase [Verrucomicrobiota bacterium]